MAKGIKSNSPEHPPPNVDQCFFSPLFYHSFKIFRHIFHIISKKCEKWTWPKTIELFHIFLKLQMEVFKNIKFKKLAFNQLGRTPPPHHNPFPQVGNQNFEIFDPFFILMDTKHFKMDFSI